MKEITIGILAIQGNFDQHRKILQKAIANPFFSDVQEFLGRWNIRCITIHNLSHVRAINALVLPGGESSTMDILLQKTNIAISLRSIIKNGCPVLATCAGTILLAEKVRAENRTQKPSVISCCPIEVERNHYGRQVHSFLASCSCIIPSLNSEGVTRLTGMFIRAPRITYVPDTAEVLFHYHDDPVVLRYKNCLLCTFHPETVGDDTLHQIFLKEVVKTILARTQTTVQPMK